MNIFSKVVGAMIGVTLIPAAAFGVLRDQDFERERRNASYHAQLRIIKIAVPVATPGACRVWGEVILVFKGMSRRFKEGEKFEFDLNCMHRNDLIPTGDTQWLEISRLQEARFIEVYLNRRQTGAGDEFVIPVWQYILIDGPTATPRCPDTTKGSSCEVFGVPGLVVSEIAANLNPGMTAVRVEVPNETMTRLRVVAAQRSRQSGRKRITVADVVADLIARRIDDLEDDVR